MWADEEEPEDQRGWKRRLGRIAVGVLLVGGSGTAIWFIADSMSRQDHHIVRTVTRIVLPPPPTPPPPPPPPPPEKVVEQPKIHEPKVVDKQPDKPQPKPRQPPASQLTAEAGTGANNYGLARGDGSGNVIGGGGLSSEVRAAIASYGRIASADVQAALRHDDKLRFARFVGEVSIWLDSSGKITRAQLAGSSGDPAVDSAVSRVLTGLTLREPPPADIPQAVRQQPIRVRARSEPG